jgi:MFS family permease
MLLVACIASGVIALMPFALAVPVSVPLLVASGVLFGISSEIFVVNWVTTMQQEIPPELLSRLSAFDAMGSLALAPVGAVIAGPVALAVGLRTALIGGGVAIVLLTLIVLAVPEVRNLRRHPAAGPAPSEVPDPAAQPVTTAPA